MYVFFYFISICAVVKVVLSRLACYTIEVLCNVKYFFFSLSIAYKHVQLNVINNKNNLRSISGSKDEVHDFTFS